MEELIKSLNIQYLNYVHIEYTDKNGIQKVIKLDPHYLEEENE